MDIYSLILTYPGNQHHINRYLKFIRTRTQDSEEYTEKHHILPKSMFPEFKDDKWNLIRLTAREHYLAHWMLWKAFGGSMATAFWCMSNSGKYRTNSRVYEEFKRQYRGKHHHNYGLKRSHETKKKMSLSRKGVPRPYMVGRRNTEEQIRRQAESLRGFKHAEESKDKISKGQLGRVWINNTKETKRVYPNEVDEYVSEGWTLGRKNK